MRTDTVETLRRYLADAPATAPAGPPDLLGYWTADGYYVCTSCAGRILARGCTIPGAEPCWVGQPYGSCCTC